MTDSKSSRPFSFYTLLCLGLIIIFRSGSVHEAIRTTAVVGLLLLFRFSFASVGYKLFTRVLIAEFFAIGSAIVVSVFYARLFPPGPQEYGSIWIEVLYALLLVPMVSERIDRKKERGSLPVALLFVGFTVTILLFSAVREICSSGTLADIHTGLGVERSIPYLENDSSAALGLSALIILFRLILRKKNRDIFDVYAKDGKDRANRVPFPEIHRERAFFGYLLSLFLFILFFGLLSYAAAYGLWVFGQSAVLIPPTVVLIHTVFAAVFFLFSRKKSEKGIEDIPKSFLFPAQVGIVLYLLSYFFSQAEMSSGILLSVARYTVLILLFWVFLTGLVSFIRVFNRKLIFGNRPNSVDGLPFIFLMIAIALIVLSSFSCVAEKLL
ncbi:MAG: hypothetical protein GXY43_06025 [Clostridiaceae bacterium]|nr:hypothetical protein [Clostridiaceae bacterium]